MNKRLFVDMDGVLCEFNKNASIEEVATKGYFAKCVPQMSVISAIRSLLERFLLENKNTEVYILSSVFMDDHSVEDKNQWLDENGLLGINNEHRLFVPYGQSKSRYLYDTVGIGEDDFLLDDFSKNLHEWHGVGIKLYNGINGTKGTWTGYSVNARSSSEVIKNTIMGIMQFASLTQKTA